MVKTYSIWVEKRGPHKYKFRQRYADPLRSAPGHIVKRTVSVILTKKTAQARAEAERILRQKIERAIADQSQGSNIAFADLSKQYQNWLRETNRPWGTRERALSSLKGPCAHFKGAVAKNITSPMITDYLEYLLYKRKPALANATVKLIKAFLSDTYEYGISHGLVKKNPVRQAKITYKNESARKRSRIENKFFTDTELRAVLGYEKYIAGRQDYYDLFKFCYETGMRIDEATGLQKTDIRKGRAGAMVAAVTGSHEYHCGELYRREEPGQARDVKSARTKTATSKREVALSPSALAICQRNMQLHPASPYLFLNSVSRRPWVRGTINHYLKRVARRLGIAKNLSTHFFRHTYISKQTEIGTPLNVIMSQVGQADSEITKQIYTHVTDKEHELLQKNLAKLDEDIKI